MSEWRVNQERSNQNSMRLIHPDSAVSFDVQWDDDQTDYCYLHRIDKNNYHGVLIPLTGWHEHWLAEPSPGMDIDTAECELRKRARTPERLFGTIHRERQVPNVYFSYSLSADGEPSREVAVPKTLLPLLIQELTRRGLQLPPLTPAPPMVIRPLSETLFAPR